MTVIRSSLNELVSLPISMTIEGLKKFFLIIVSFWPINHDEMAQKQVDELGT